MLICPDCFENSSLQNRIKEIRPSFDEGQCEQHPSKKGVPIGEVARIMDEVITNNYYVSGFDYHGEPTGLSLIDLIYDLTGANHDDVATALQNAIIDNESWWPGDGGEPFFSEENGYDRITEVFDEHRSQKWEDFCGRIVSEQRFFNDRAQQTLSEIFDGLQLLRDDRNEPAIHTLEPGKLTIFRARRANNSKSQETISSNVAQELGPPPPSLRMPGRMNPSGIPSFYGAFDLDTALAELRPAVGETIMAAQFEFVRPVVVLDTTKFERPPKALNIFAKTHNKRLSLWGFMAEFMNEISQPCLPGDEHLDYIPTQVVAEYLVHLHRFKHMGQEKTVEGIIFRSAQNREGKNIVLFGDAAKVKTHKSKPIKRLPLRDQRPPTLEVIENSLTTQVIAGVQVQATPVYSGVHEDDYDF
ncbi:RES family NAD+ phosphorylase [Shimia thalassica]|uniref:RES family NAD+ phosphorylase n=1 Tax=Shimia thalassica TaxID=1715693 RepID=UPI00273538A2|nr:RES family NAD+ phosphorylase [Shimia thalassica]MDP2496182.1 RES family NAD+ phosphorylase [Shimia thalassica]